MPNARVTAFLGLDLSNFASGLDKAGELGGTFKHTLERKFGLKDVMKGLFAGIGIGSVERLTELISAPFRVGAEDAKRAADMTESLADATMAAIAEQGGLEQKLALNHRRYQDMNDDIETTKKLLAQQEADPLRWAPQRAEDLRATKDHLATMIVKQAELGHEGDKMAFALKLQNREIDRQLFKLRDVANLSGKSLAIQIEAHRARAQIFDHEAENPRLTADERIALRLEAAANRSEATVKEKELAKFQEEHADRMHRLDLAQAALRSTSEEKIVAMQKESARLKQRSLDVSRTEAERSADEAAAKEMSTGSEALQINRATQRRAIEETIQNIKVETAALGETTEEKILRLKKEALKYQERSNDLSRSEAERDTDRVKAAQTMAQAAAIEYSFKNKPLTVAEAAAPTATGRQNTTSVGVTARRIQRYGTLADSARRQGRYGAAEHYDSLGRAEQTEFEKADRAARDAAREAAKGGPTPGSWDARYGKQMADRQRLLDVRNRAAIKPTAADEAYNRRFAPGYQSDHDSAYNSRFQPGGGEELKQAAQELKAAAAELKNVEVTIDYAAN